MIFALSAAMQAAFFVAIKRATSSPSQSSLRDASSPKGRASGETVYFCVFDRMLFRHAKASPFGRGGCEHSEQTERASPLAEMPLRDILKYKKEPLRKTMCNGSFHK